MQFSARILTAALLLADFVSAKAISFPARALRRSYSHNDIVHRAVGMDGELERRSTASLNVASASATTSISVATACSSAVSAMTTVANSAGFAGCYNILAWDPKTAMFQADLRIYQQGPSTGSFANMSISQITVLLTYPESTQFKSLVKRSMVETTKRDDNAQIQQYSLAGNLKIDVSKLNQTQLASLMIPQISLQAKQASTQNTIKTNMTATDSAWFIAGQFTNISAQAVQVANPATASAAIIAAKGFVLPGTTLGIFPTGLIVTSVWTLIFLSAFGLGTWGRTRSRNLFRKRTVVVTLRAPR